MKFIELYFNLENVRSFTDDSGDIWFHGTHVCKVLEYSNPRDAIPYNVDENDRRKIDIGGLNDAWFVNECGLYDLIIACRKPVAKPFHKWLSHKALPQIRRTGLYIDESRFDSAEVDRLKAVVADRDNRISKLESNVRIAENYITEKIAKVNPSGIAKASRPMVDYVENKLGLHLCGGDRKKINYELCKQYGGKPTIENVESVIIALGMNKK